MGNMYNPNDVHIQQALNDLAIKYTNAETIWRQVMPIKKVQKRSDKYYVFDKATAFQRFDDTLAPNAMPNEAQWKLSTDNYSVVDHGLGSWIPLEAIENADDPLDPAADEVENLSEALENQQEARVASKVFSAASYPTGNKITLSGTSQWSDYTNSDPLAAIEDAADSLTVPPNTLVLGADTWRVMRRHPKVAARLFPLGGNASVAGAGATVQQLQQYLSDFGIERVLVGRRRVNTANIGQPPNLVRAWGKHAALLHVQENPGVKTLTFGVTFVETERNVYQEIDYKRGVKGSLFTKVAWNSDEKIIAPDAGFLFENAVA